MPPLVFIFLWGHLRTANAPSVSYCQFARLLALQKANVPARFYFFFEGHLRTANALSLATVNRITIFKYTIKKSVHSYLKIAAMESDKHISYYWHIEIV